MEEYLTSLNKPILQATVAQLIRKAMKFGCKDPMNKIQLENVTNLTTIKTHHVDSTMFDFLPVLQGILRQGISYVTTDLQTILRNANNVRFRCLNKKK